MKILDAKGGVDPSYQLNPTGREIAGSNPAGRFKLKPTGYEQWFTDWKRTAQELVEEGYELVEGFPREKELVEQFATYIGIITEKSGDVKVPPSELKGVVGRADEQETQPPDYLHINIHPVWDHLVGDPVDARGRLVGLSVSDEGKYLKLNYHGMPPGTSNLIKDRLEAGALLDTPSDEVKNRVFPEDNLVSFSHCADQAKAN